MVLHFYSEVSNSLNFVSKIIANVEKHQPTSTKPFRSVDSFRICCVLDDFPRFQLRRQGGATLGDDSFDFGGYFGLKMARKN